MEKADQWEQLVADCLEMITWLIDVMRDEYPNVGVEEEALAELQTRYGALLARGIGEKGEGSTDHSV